MPNLIRIPLISHLEVSNDRAKEAKDFLKSAGNLNKDYLPIKKANSILWPLNNVPDNFEGKIVKCKGLRNKNKTRDYRSILSEKIKSIAPRSFDIFGNIAIIRLKEDSMLYGREIAKALLLSHKNIETVCIDLGVQGEYRLRNLVNIGGKNNFISIHKENGLIFEADISRVYFSPRLATERQRISSLVKGREIVLDAFAGVAPFSISLAKKGCEVLALDSNPDAKKWALRNFRNNNISSEKYVYHSCKFEEFDFKSKKFDRIIVNSPTNSLQYLDRVLNLVAKRGLVHFYIISSKDGSFCIDDFISSQFECTSIREVHPYSPSTSLFAFDVRRNLT
tara:strand:+ start:31 stop:1038 length:1008 start_codon:yes stop_codon:yes gene_type:complete